MTDQIKPGSVVQLKSGGPRMTARWVEGAEAFCDWFTTEKAPWTTAGMKYALTSLKILEP